MAFTLPPLPYEADALAPFISADALLLHHDKHHATYVQKLNAALEKHPDLQARSVEDLVTNLSSVPEAVRTAVRNHGGGHLNHTTFWELMTKANSQQPRGEAVDAIQETFGGFDGFREQFNAAAGNHFGSGWVWLVAADGKLEIMTLPNQDSPLTSGKQPLLLNDLWEHAYYVQYQNRKAEYFEAWFNLINWDGVNQRYAAARA